MEDQLLISVLAIVTAVYGMGTSYLQERFGSFQSLSPQIKQLLNALINLAIPYAAVAVQPYWRPDFGDLNAALQSLLLLFAPVLVWLFSQVGHQIDRLLQGQR